MAHMLVCRILCRLNEPRHDKKCLREFPTGQTQNQPGQPQKLASLEISAIESRDIILCKQRTTQVLIRLRGCAGCSVPLLFAYDIRPIFFSWRGSNIRRQWNIPIYTLLDWWEILHICIVCVYCILFICVFCRCRHPESLILGPYTFLYLSWGIAKCTKWCAPSNESDQPAHK